MADETPYIVPKDYTRPRSLQECAAELTREINIRKRCYDRWVRDGKLDEITAAERFERLLGVMHFLNKAFPVSGDAGAFTNPMTRNT